jgi:hypothetical protein
LEKLKPAYRLLAQIILLIENIKLIVGKKNLSINNKTKAEFEIHLQKARFYLSSLSKKYQGKIQNLM